MPLTCGVKNRAADAGHHDQRGESVIVRDAGALWIPRDFGIVPFTEKKMGWLTDAEVDP